MPEQLHVLARNGFSLIRREIVSKEIVLTNQNNKELRLEKANSIDQSARIEKELFVTHEEMISETVTSPLVIKEEIKSETICSPLVVKEDLNSETVTSPLVVKEENKSETVTTSIVITEENKNEIVVKEEVKAFSPVIADEIQPPLAVEIAVETTPIIDYYPAPQEYYSYPLELQCNSVPVPKRIALSHVEGSGKFVRPYRSNFSLAEILLAPDASIGTLLPMIDLRGYRFDDAKYALSVGLMGRYILDDCCYCNIFGANIYYDYAPDTPGYSNQISAGLEILGPRFDIRANFYAPFGRHRNQERSCSRNSVNGWLAYGFNAELGYLAYCSDSFFLYTAVGPYYITACRCEERQRGGMLRIVPQYKDFLALNLKFSYDPVFRGIFQAEIIVSLPLYQIGSPPKTPCGFTNRQIYQRVERL